MENVKLCVMCNEVKSLDTEYYKAGPFYQKHCKVCHNSIRVKYHSEHYIKKEKTPKPIIPKTPKPKGFNKLPEHIRTGIIYDLYIKINHKNIVKKYESECKFTDQSLGRWIKAGQIPSYIKPA